jgi:hypothetical protein
LLVRVELALQGKGTRRIKGLKLAAVELQNGMGRIAIRSGPKISSRHGRSIELVLRSISCARWAARTGNWWSGVGTEGEGLRQRMVQIERQRLRTCQSLRRPESRSLLPALRLPSLSCSFGTWEILARFDRRKCPYIKHGACQSGIPQASVFAKTRVAEK